MKKAPAGEPGAFCHEAFRPTQRHGTLTVIRIAKPKNDMPQSRWPPKPLCLAPLFIALTTIGIRASIGPQIIDDAYITFRYARNIAEGAGFVYNVGERVLGTTTPLWSLALAFLYSLGLRDLPHFAVALGAILDGLSSTLIFWVCFRGLNSAIWATLASVLFAISAGAITYTNGGMETPLFVFLVLAACAAEIADRPHISGGAAGLATIARPEGLIIVVLIAAAESGNAKRLMHFGLAVAATLMPWLVFAILYFGTFVPHSVAAKAVVYAGKLGNPLYQGANLLAPLGLPGFASNYIVLHSRTFNSGIGLAAAFILIALIFAPTLFRFLRSQRQWVPLAGFAPVFLVAYTVACLRGVAIFPWYVTPLIAFFVIGIVVIVARSMRKLPAPLAGLPALILIGWALAGLNLGRDPRQPFLLPVGMDLTREQAYSRAAFGLAGRATASSVIAAQEIGALGWATRSKILDTAGLVSPMSLSFHPLPNSYTGDAVSADLIAAARPEFIVAADAHLQPPLVDADWFSREYIPLSTIEAPFPPLRIGRILVFERINHSGTDSK